MFVVAAALLSARVQELCAIIYQYGEERLRSRAVLCEIYHHAMHDRFFSALISLAFTPYESGSDIVFT